MDFENKKNIIVIFVDAFRAKNLSLFGYHKETDKNLKNIAKENIWFKNHFSVSNSTAPALTSFLTGKYPFNHGIIHQLPYTKTEEIDKINKTDFWIPSYLKTKGYETIAIDWIGLWFTKGFDCYEEGRSDSSKLFSSAHEMTELAISKIEKSKKPFFLFMHFWDTHFPFPNTDYTPYDDERVIEETLNSIEDESQREYLKKRLPKAGLYSIPDIINKYDLSIKNIDIEIGRLYEFLKKQSLLEDTILVILGDHGESLTEHGIYFSSSGLYDETIHVPMIMHLPGFEKKEISELTESIDIPATIFDYLGFETEKFDGKSFLMLLKYGKKIKDRVFLVDGLCEDIRAVRTKTKKLIIAKDNFCNLCKSSHHKNIELYDLEKDCDEKENIYSGEKDFVNFLFPENNV